MWRRSTAGAIAMVFLATACAQARPGITVQKLALDVAFGAKEVTPANFGPAPLPPNYAPPSIPIFATPSGPQPKQEACPQASINTFPAKAASPNVEGLAPVGLYRWARKGEAEVMFLTLKVKIKLKGFETRVVRNAQQISDTMYGFETVQTDMNGTTVVTTWEVNRVPVVEDVAVLDDPEVHPRVGEPERGVVLTKVQNYNAKGALTGTFTPVPGILYLPLPVVAGESWTSVGTDPATGQTLRHDGTVQGRQRVDACGEIIEGWAVTGHETIASASAADRDYDYVVATQYGGILAREVIKGTTSAGTLDATFSIGQLTPSPMPKENS